VYISQLVKTRDPYPGLLQIASIVLLSFQSAFPSLPLSLLLLLSSLFSHHQLRGGAATPSHSQGDLVLARLVSNNASHVLHTTSARPSRTNG
jgi:hypothetical protein